MDTSITITSSPRRYSLSRLVKFIFIKVTVWNELSCSRKRLAELPKHLLEDVGLTKEQAQIESRKPFWQ
ncbi:DUF1127 domain-containing protein [Vibrio genomosp. F10]|uniref:DUF1127 domain-containing protein n=2 Tax=Vibrio genomosp. F10 TaxID=723171 RepID=A0A1B9QV09_9VIBR|nr:DUF1127 domain-containing protein [Vibrio genomosp. F10]OCH71866.1 hypothetical protein A6E14_15865 [Vibrio genomosp. F10]OEE31595.1 hypothetical protein A1QO_01965 [Vibrio genomosp. F10 str. ZF-129]OEE82304.1 hypothetical protein A1QK_04390 [Vibrio genomosp. F10 str. 9ZD137]OEE95220.1 hypothetical protein A1QM_00600 [Vibrio genomosp. F10 str. 9ZC157]OEF08135.1 hypothetical protein A1QI_16470 [Vibrio genomosp. F10 str. 9ZB36]